MARRLPVTLSFISLALFTAVAAVPAVEMPAPLPPLREQAAIRQEWLKARLEQVLPGLMRRHGVAMWIVVSREHN